MTAWCPTKSRAIISVVASSRIPRQVSGFTLERLDDELLLYHPGLTRTVHLNETASLIWQLCDGRRSSQQITALLQESYPDGGAQIVEDVETALMRLARDGAIEFA